MRLIKLLLLCSILGTLAQAQSLSEEAPKLQHFDPKLTDATLDPCQDFYKYSCQKWFSANPIPADQVYWGTGSGLNIWNLNVSRETMELAAAKKSGRSQIEQQVGDYWSACMDEKGIDATASHQLAPELERIAAVKDKAALIDEVAHLHKTLPAAWAGNDNQTPSPMFGFGSSQDLDDASLVVLGVDQGGLALPNRDFYLKDDAKSVEIRNKYQAHIRKMFELSGEGKESAAQDAEIVLKIESDLARPQMDNVSRRDPKKLNNKFSLDQLQTLTPNLNWKRYIELVGGPPTHHYLVSSPDFFKALNQLIADHPLDHWKTYLRWHLLHGSAAYLSAAFVDENFAFYGHTLSGSEKMQPRWRRCVRAADRDLGEVLGQAYVARAFPPESKQRVVNLVHDVEAALVDDIHSVDWMSPKTKDEAVKKLQGIEDKIGYPNKWRDYSSLKVAPDSYLHNVHAATAFEFKRQLDKVGKPVDRGEWTMTPPTINAYYDPQLNTINFPAGILQPPYFEKDLDPSVNYGAIGAVIGHEITHGFDDEGRQFDATGNLRDWWTPEDSKAYDERGKCIANEYTEEIPEAGPGVKQDGRLTQGEDTADNGGTRLALMALEAALKKEGKTLDDKGPDGWTNRQRFFLAYSYSWCEEVRPEALRTQVLTNPHSVAKYRVNNTLANMPEFQQAFGCKKGAPMVHENACRVW
jgi:endothelin-converting enzyme/putative endopeptidase